eukprot:3451842-Prymnesium_polylepis.1
MSTCCGSPARDYGVVPRTTVPRLTQQAQPRTRHAARPRLTRYSSIPRPVRLGGRIARVHGDVVFEVAV